MTLTPLQIKNKLRDGADPLDLSIEIWEEKLLIARNRFGKYDIDLGSDTCPLCIKYKSHDGRENCGECPLAKHNFKCGDRNSIYFDVYMKLNGVSPITTEAYTREQKIGAIRNMVNLLKLCKKYETKDLNTMVRYRPFTEIEVKERMFHDADIYDLSIEIWEARRNYIALGGRMKGLHIGSSLCPLCITFRNRCAGKKYQCDTCPLAKIGEPCGKAKGAYMRVVFYRDYDFIPEFIRRPLMVKAMDRMIRVLREAKCMNR